MSGPISGVGLQQPPITQTFQPGRGVENKQDQNTQQQQDVLNRVSSQETGGSNPVGGTQQSASGNDGAKFATNQQSDGEKSSGDGRRGGLVNITV
jgi:hypothetical protein